MNQPWPNIVAHYEQTVGGGLAMKAMLALSKRIANSPLASGLHAWTSMFDLCIAQTEAVYPYNGPYLKVSPLQDGRVEFRYLDTQDKDKQWARTVEAIDAVPRLLKLLAQLHWFAPETLIQ